MIFLIILFHHILFKISFATLLLLDSLSNTIFNSLIDTSGPLYNLYPISFLLSKPLIKSDIVVYPNFTP